MKLGKALSTGYAKDAYEHDTDDLTDRLTDDLTAPAQAEPPAPDRAEDTAEAARPRQMVDAAAR